MVGLLIGFLVGAVLGSFIKAIADRSLHDRSFFGRSNCLYCHKKINWYDLIPIFSYILLKGKCRNCQKPFGKEYLIIELFSGLVFGLLFWKTFLIFPGLDNNFKFLLFIFDLFVASFFVTVLLILALTDIKKMLIPDRIILPSIVILLGLLIVNSIYKVWLLYFTLSQNLIGKYLLPPHSDYFFRHSLAILDPLKWSILIGLLIAGFFMLLIILTKGKGMGGGDVKLGGFIGLGLGFPLSLVALMGAFFSGAAYSIFLILLKRKKLGESVPFGPFLVLGSIVALLWGQEIINWYLQLSSQV